MSTNHNSRWLSYNQWSVYKPGKFATEKSWIYFLPCSQPIKYTLCFEVDTFLFKVKHIHVYFPHTKYERTYWCFSILLHLGAVFLVVHLYASVPVGHLFILYKFLTQVLQTSSRHWWDVEVSETAYRSDYHWLQINRLQSAVAEIFEVAV